MARAKTLVKVFEYFIGHVIDWALVFVKFKKVAELFGRLFVGVKVHVCLGLEFLPGLVLFLAPGGFFFVLEKGWLVLLNFFLLTCILDSELLLCHTVLSNLLLKKV